MVSEQIATSKLNHFFLMTKCSEHSRNSSVDCNDAMVPMNQSKTKLPFSTRRYQDHEDTSIMILMLINTNKQDIYSLIMITCFCKRR